MIRLLDAKQSGELDQGLISLGIEPNILMENAGRELAAYCQKVVPTGRLVMVCGTGNNGGDGIVCARHCLQSGRAVDVVLVGDEAKASTQSRTQLEIWRALKQPVIAVDSAQSVAELTSLLQEADGVIDALFGVGLDRDVGGIYADVIDLINKVRVERELVVIAADVPSGVDATTGAVLGTAVIADHCMCFLSKKIGCALTPGASHSGVVVSVDIGAPVDLGHCRWFELDRASARELLPDLGQESHKGKKGRVLCVGGAQDMTGAVLLSARSAQRVGAGAVTVMALSGSQDVSAYPSLMTQTLPKQMAELDLSGFDVVIVGPGLGQGEQAKSLVKHIWQSATCPVVVDADALRLASVLGLSFDQRFVATPHPGEAADFVGQPAASIQNDRYTAAKKLADLGGVWVLKGARSVCIDAQTYVVNPFADALLATAGSGDVLAGAIGGFLGQGLTTRDAACLSMFVHGSVAQAFRAGGFDAISADDILQQLPLSLAQIRH